MTAHAERATPAAVREFLTALDRAILTWGIYPRSSEFVDGAVREVADTRNAIGGPLRLDVRPTHLIWTASNESGDCTEAEGLARTLHYQQIARVTVQNKFDERSGGAFIAAIAAGKNETPSPLLTQAQDGLEVEPLDVGALFSDGELVDGQDPWTNLLGRFSANSGRNTTWHQLAMDPDQARRFLAWTVESDNDSAELRGYAAPDRIGLACERILAETDANAAPAIAQACAGMAQLDPEVWLELLSDDLPVGEEESAVDLTSAITGALSQQQVLKIARYALATRSAPTPRLYQFFHRIVSQREDGAALTRAASEQQVPAGGAWQGFVDLLDSEDSSAWVSRDYRGTLETPDSALPNPDQLWDSSQLRRRWAEMDPGFVRTRKARILVALLERETEDDDYLALAEALEDTLADLVDMRCADLLEEIVEVAEDHREDARRSELQRRQAGRLLNTLAEPGLLTQIIAILADNKVSDDRALWRVVDTVGPSAVPHLIEALEAGGSTEFRRLVARAVRRLPSPPIEHLRHAVMDARAPIARNAAWLTAQLSHPEAPQVLGRALKHDAPEVRREAVVGLAASAEEFAEEAIVRALSDPVLEVRHAAAVGLRNRLSSRPEDRVREYLARSNWHGRNTGVIVAAAQALGHLSNGESLQALRRLAQRPLLFRKRRHRVQAAAIAAIAAIEQRTSRESTAPEASLEVAA